MRAGDLHAGAQSTGRPGGKSTETDDDVGNTTHDVGQPNRRLSARRSGAPGVGRRAPEQAEEPPLDVRFGRPTPETCSELSPDWRPPTDRSPGDRTGPKPVSCHLIARETGPHATRAPACPMPRTVINCRRGACRATAWEPSGIHGDRSRRLLVSLGDIWQGSSPGAGGRDRVARNWQEVDPTEGADAGGRLRAPGGR